MVDTIQIGPRSVGPGHPCWIIAEAGVNHNGQLELAEQLVEAAADAGADAVKFQTFRAAALVAPGAPKAAYQRRGRSDAEPQREMLRRLELSETAHRHLWALCRRRGIQFLSTPFEERSAALLHRLGVPAFKVSSGEVTNLPFLSQLAHYGKPLLLSTGMSTLGEVEAAVATVQAAGNRRLALLHCVSAYPARPRDVNLRALETLAQAFGLPVGYSDHTLGTAIALAAVARGACIVEKHITLDRSLPGPDHRASIEPGELRALVRGIRDVEDALGTGRKRPAAAECAVAAVARKSLVARCTLARGKRIRAEHLAVQRPGTGLAPSLFSLVVGRRARRRIPAGTPLTLEMFG